MNSTTGWWDWCVGQIRPLIATANTPAGPRWAQNLPVCVLIVHKKTQTQNTNKHFFRSSLSLNLPVCVLIIHSTAQNTFAHSVFKIRKVATYTARPFRLIFLLPVKLVTRLCLSHPAHFGLYSSRQLRCHYNSHCINIITGKHFLEHISQTIW